MSKESKEKSKGFYENPDPLLGKAKQHHEAALRTEFEKHRFTDATTIVPSKSKDKEEQNIISICLSIKEEDRSKFDEATEKFVKKLDCAQIVDSELSLYI